MREIAIFSFWLLAAAPFIDCIIIIPVSPTCDYYNESCTTISDVVEFLYTEANSSESINLILFPGSHFLADPWFLHSSLECTVTAESLYSRPTLTCAKLAHVSLSGSSTIYIEGIELHDCTFLNEMSTLLLNYSSFHANGDHYIHVNNSNASILNTELFIPLHIFYSDVTLMNLSLTNNHLSNVYQNHSSTTAVLTISNSMVSMSDVNIANNSVGKYDRVIIVNNSTLSISSRFMMTENIGILISGSSSVLTMSGSITISDNCGLLQLTSCKLTLIGHLNITNNYQMACCPEPSELGLITTRNSTAMYQGDIHVNDNMLGAFCIDQSQANFFGRMFLSGNTGDRGGAVFASNSFVNFDSLVSITNNTAATFGGAFYTYQSTLTFTNTSLISHNRAGKSGGGFFLYLSQINFHQKMDIQRNIANNGGGIYAISSRVRFYTKDVNQQVNITIAYNQAQNGNGGGIYLSTNSKIQLLKFDRDLLFYDTNDSLISVHFIENNATMKGGGIFVDDHTDFPSCTPTDELLSDCFIQILEVYSYSPPNGRSDRSTNVFFLKNSAKNGNSFYGGLTDRCKKSFFSQSKFSTIYKIYDPDLYDRYSDPLSVRFCSNYSSDIHKGQSINISVAAYNQNLQKVPARVFLKVNSGHGGLKEGQDIETVSNTCSNINFNVISSQTSENLIIYAEGPCLDSQLSSLTLPISFKHCPIGFQLSESSTECVCDSSISTFTCDVESETVIRFKNNSWVNYVNMSNASGLLIYPYCPYDYCQPPSQPISIDFNNIDNGSDSQCAFKRSGILCGGCQDGLSLVVGSSNCKKCGNFTLLLVIPIATAGIILVFMIMFLNFTVDVGTINGLILYCNTMAVLNSNPKTTYTDFLIEWINLGLGFETCFYNGMDEYSRAWLELAFPFYLITLVIIMMTTSEKSSKLARLLGSSNPVAALATLIFISYARLLRASMNIISLGILTYPNGRLEYVWLVDANILYLRGKHVPLFLAGAVILIISMTYTFFLMLQHLIPCECTKAIKWLDSPKLKSFMDAYHAPFLPAFRGWCGLLLLYRFIVFLVASLNYNGDQEINLLCVAILSFATISIKNMCGKIYKTWVSHIETVFLLNLGFFSVAEMYVRQMNDNLVTFLYVSHCVAIATLLCIFLIHLDMKFKLVAKLTKIRRQKPSEPISEVTASVGTISTEYMSTSVHYSSISDSNGRSGSKTGSQITSIQQDNREVKSFDELREELLDF